MPVLSTPRMRSHQRRVTQATAASCVLRFGSFPWWHAAPRRSGWAADAAMNRAALELMVAASVLAGGLEGSSGRARRSRTGEAAARASRQRLTSPVGVGHPSRMREADQLLVAGVKARSGQAVGVSTDGIRQDERVEGRSVLAATGRTAHTRPHLQTLTGNRRAAATDNSRRAPDPIMSITRPTRWLRGRSSTSTRSVIDHRSVEQTRRRRS
jgi:hypothetical protein